MHYARTEPGSGKARADLRPTLIFHLASSGEYVTQVMEAASLGLEYLDPMDDPGSRR
jgi:hypothetical protein